MEKNQIGTCDNCGKNTANLKEIEDIANDVKVFVCPECEKKIELSNKVAVKAISFALILVCSFVLFGSILLILFKYVS